MKIDFKPISFELPVDELRKAKSPHDQKDILSQKGFDPAKAKSLLNTKITRKSSSPSDKEPIPRAKTIGCGPTSYTLSSDIESDSSTRRKDRSCSSSDIPD